jgi:RNA polymerase sigma-70 factor, ECF subfamily
MHPHRSKSRANSFPLKGSLAFELPMQRAPPGAVCVLNQSGFETMVRAFRADLFRFACSLCHNRWQAEDLLQEAFAAAWKGRESLRDYRAAKAWLFSILHNEHVQVCRRRHLELVQMEPDSFPLVNDIPDLDRVELSECLAALPEAYRSPLVLQALGGFSGQEIAGMLQISAPNVMTRLKRARRAMAKVLGDSKKLQATKRARRCRPT